MKIPRLLHNLWPWLAAASTGIALTFCFAPYEQDWLVWLALVPLLCASWFGKLSPLRRLLAGALAGVLFFGSTFYWLGKVTPAGWLGLTLYLSLYPAIWTWLAGFPAFRIPLTKPLPGESPWLRSLSSLAVAGSLASAWSLLEWLRGALFGGFGWNTLGVALHRNIPFVQLASLGGVPLISWLIVFANIIVVTTITRLLLESRRLTFASRSDFTFALALLLGGFTLGLSLSFDKIDNSPLQEIKISLIQSGTTSEPLDSYLRLSSLALLQNPDLIVWPESAPGRALLDSLDDLKTLAKKYDLSLDTVNAWLITGSQEHGPEGSFNSAFAIAPRLTGFQTYRKRHLLPFYESDFTVGKSSQPLWIVGTDARFGPLICIEDTLPRLAQDNLFSGANILLNLTDDSLFDDRPVELQHFQNALFRAPETGLPLLRCAHTGITAIMDRHGSILQSLPPNSPGILTGKISCRIHPPRTFFSQFGFVFPLSWTAWIAARFFFYRKKINPKAPAL